MVMKKVKRENHKHIRFYFILDGEQTPKYNVPEGEAYRRLRGRFDLSVRQTKELQRAGVLRRVKEDQKVHKENGVATKQWITVRNPNEPEFVRLKLVVPEVPVG
jgi:hypothetical protein